MTVTDVKLRKYFPSGALAAIYSVTFDGMLAVHDIKLIRHDGSYLLVMPSRKVQSGEYKDIVHPITKEFRAELEKTVLNYHINTDINTENV